jgi:hypothetical protein
MRTFTVYGSDGELLVSAASGRVLACEDCDEGNYADIVFFNVDEWRNTRPGVVPDHVDILDIGYWMATGEYEPPETDWRKLIASAGG